MGEDSDEVSEMIQRVLNAVAPRVEDVADEADLSPHSLWAWAKQRRNPSPDSLRKLAKELDRRGGLLNGLADELRDEARKRED